MNEYTLAVFLEVLRDYGRPIGFLRRLQYHYYVWRKEFVSANYLIPQSQREVESCNILKSWMEKNENAFLVVLAPWRVSEELVYDFLSFLPTAVTVMPYRFLIDVNKMLGTANCDECVGLERHMLYVDEKFKQDRLFKVFQ